MPAIQYINIFQVGETVIHLHDQNAQPYQIETDVDRTRFLHSPRQVMPEGRGIYKDRTIDVEGRLFSLWNKHPHTTIGHLASYVGTTVPIIGYIITGRTHPIGCACGCRNCKPDDEIVWMIAHGIVESVDGNDIRGKTQTELELELTLIDNWKPLPIYFWHWGHDLNKRSLAYANCLPEGGRPYDEYVVCPPRIDQLPKIFGGQSCKDYKFHYQQIDKNGLKSLLYDFSFWASTTADCFCLGQPEGWQACTWKPGDSPLYFESDRGLWSAPPSSIFGLRNLPSTGKIIGTVTAEGNPLNEEYTIEFDLDRYVQDLEDAGYEFDSNHEVVFGDVDLYHMGEHYRPAFVRNAEGEILLGVHPKFKYSRQYPMQFNAGTNSVRFRWSGFEQTFEVAYLMMPGRA